MAGRKKTQADNGNGDRTAISYVKKIEPEMLTNTYVDKETKKVDPRYGRAFVIERLRRACIAQLPGITLEEWNNLSTEIFQAQLDFDRDEKQAAADAVLDRAADDPELLESLERKLAAIKAAKDSRVSDRGRGAPEEALVG